MSVQVVCIIPSRYESTRFPGKPLADLCGKPMIQHVYERVLRAKTVSFAAVATDDERIFHAVAAFGGRAVMTSPRHRSGTDRIAEAVETMGLRDDDIVVNIQGDQPLFEPVQVDEVVGPLLADAAVPMSTLIYRIVLDEEITHPNAVKVVFDHDHFALYFSRATIPFVRDPGKKVEYFKHHGIYAYRRDFLRTFTSLTEGSWSAWRRSNSSARSNTAIGSRWSSPRTTPSRWIPPRSWSGSGGCLTGKSRNK